MLRRGLNKRKLNIILICIFALTIIGSTKSFAVEKTQQEMITNPGFEKENTSGWTWEQNGVIFGTIPGIDTGMVNSGNYSLGGGWQTELPKGVPEECWYYQDVDLTGSDELLDGGIITFSAYINELNDHTIDGIEDDKGYLEILFLDDNGNQVGESYKSVKGQSHGKFTFQTVQGNVPKTAKTVRAKLVFSIERPIGLEVYFDDASLKLTYSKVSVAFISNGKVFIKKEGLRPGEIINNNIVKRPEKEGYTFLEWNTSPEGNGEVYNPGQVVGNRDITYHAIFKKDESVVEAASNSEEMHSNAGQVIKESRVDDTQVKETEPSRAAVRNTATDYGYPSAYLNSENQNNVMAYALFTIAGLSAIWFGGLIFSDVRIIMWHRRKLGR